MAVLNPARLLAHATGALALVAWLACDAHAATLQTLDAALAATFPGARIESRALTLTVEDQRAVAQRAHARCDSRLVTAYVAWRGDSLVGAAYTDRRVVRTREALLFVAVAPDTTVRRIDVLAFFEPPDYQPPARWLARFEHQSQSARLAPGGAIPNLSGATLTSRAVAESARLALAWHELLLVPSLSATSSHTRRPR